MLNYPCIIPVFVLTGIFIIATQSEDFEISSYILLYRVNTIKGMDFETQTVANVADVPSAIGLICLTLEPCNFTLNIFLGLCINIFKQERQCLCNY